MIIPIVICVGCFLLMRRLVKLHSMELQKEACDLRSQIVHLDQLSLIAKRQEILDLQSKLECKINQNKEELENFATLLKEKEQSAHWVFEQSELPIAFDMSIIRSRITEGVQ